MISKKNLKASLESNKALRETYEDLYKTAVNELRFEKMQADYLLDVLNKIEELASQKINSKIIELIIANAKERQNLDKMIHSSLLFNS